MATLVSLTAVLVRNESRWAGSIADLGAAVAEAATPDDVQVALRQLLAVFGGMGSFNDLVLQTSSGVSTDQTYMDLLRSRLYALATEMIS